ncbi:FAA hydrolase family protein [Mesorhizobium sp. M7A.F.Ca.US.006.01.1.1]|uniref:fumarylacetoacetate hydrolase family protein n=1 Tax=Mesorhizobium sp. M7A.F.Ca.US.006.01.1.1 TaxID=2496707 RepID=UPI000FCAC8B8|nr:fumarylacetoacetate hydrolase family protein [Mesorhizobium sp. M7A.F.Ca.US.006.01.1.1]RUZ70601.1 FAA hydrolase family protein [Mesorhizobium sp. M7A.F.Ca.US.006.01.1.1]
MRFLSFSARGQRGLAYKTQTTWLGLMEDAARWPGDLDDIVRSGDYVAAAEALKTGKPIDLEQVTCELPFRRAGKVLCVGLNYADHASESNMVLPEFPTVFVRFNSNLVSHNADLVQPKVSAMFDYEGELVAVIGKAGRAIPIDSALDHVAGYTIFNDGSIRDYQLRTTQWTIGKNFDNTGSMGPEFVTSDEVPAGAKGLRLQTRLNGEVLQDANTDLLVFSIADLVSKLSIGMTLEPGDLIVSGTPSGVGFARDPKILMRPGDVCEVEIEKIGLLRNAVVAEA